jgi:alpha-beta hydrolase superfamily lysophospholipase
MFIMPIRLIASQTQTTPDRVDAIVFCSPCVLPPAAKNKAHATMPAGTARLAIAPTFTHRAISTPMLTASAISMSIRCSLLLIVDDSENGSRVRR